MHFINYIDAYRFGLYELSKEKYKFSYRLWHNMIQEITTAYLTPRVTLVDDAQNAIYAIKAHIVERELCSHFGRQKHNKIEILLTDTMIYYKVENVISGYAMRESVKKLNPTIIPKYYNTRIAACHSGY